MIVQSQVVRSNMSMRKGGDVIGLERELIRDVLGEKKKRRRKRTREIEIKL